MVMRTNATGNVGRSVKSEITVSRFCGKQNSDDVRISQEETRMVKDGKD